jgi:hypothetical protein
MVDSTSFMGKIILPEWSTFRAAREISEFGLACIVPGEIDP